MNTKDEKRAGMKPAELIGKAKEKMKALRRELTEKAGRIKWLRIAAEAALYGLCGFLFSSGKMLFGTYPLGIAFLSATTKDLWAVYIGAAAAAFSKGREGILLFVVYSAALALRLRMNVFYKDQDRVGNGTVPVGVRAVLAVVVSFAVGIAGCISERFSLHALMALLFYMLASGTFVFLYAGFFGAYAKPLWYRIAKIALLFSAVYGCSSFRIYGFSIAAALAAFLCFYFAEEGDLLSCGLLGVAVGIACGRDYVPVMALLALVTGAVYKYSARIAPWLGILAGFGWAFYVRGSSAFLYVLPDLVCGLLLYIPASAFKNKKKERALFAAEKKESVPAGTEAAAPLEALSNDLYALSGQLRLPEKKEAERLLLEGMDGACASCIRSCRSDGELRGKLSELLFEAGQILPERLPEKLKKNCRMKDELCSAVNDSYRAYLSHLTAAAGNDCCASCYKSVARTLADNAAQRGLETSENPEYTALFEKALKKLGIGFASCRATGRSEIVLRAEDVNTADLGKSAVQLRALFEEECGLALSLPELSCEDGRTALIFRRRERFSGESGAFSLTKEGEEFCGDSVVSFTCRHAFYLLLCDGMGSGREASLVSGVSCRFFERLTECGASPETVVDAVNEYLLSSSLECCTTIDLLRLDLFDGSCTFIKCGACPSLVLRGDNLFKLSSENIPAGGAKDLCPEPVHLELRAGDRVLLFSDGIGDSAETASFLPDLIAGKLGDDPEDLARGIVLRDDRESARSDDRTAAVLLIKEAG